MFKGNIILSTEIPAILLKVKGKLNKTGISIYSYLDRVKSFIEDLNLECFLVTCLLSSLPLIAILTIWEVFSFIVGVKLIFTLALLMVLVLVGKIAQCYLLFE